MRGLIATIFWMAVGGVLTLFLEHHTTFWHAILEHRITFA